MKKKVVIPVIAMLVLISLFLTIMEGGFYLLALTFSFLLVSKLIFQKVMH